MKCNSLALFVALPTYFLLEVAAGAAPSNHGDFTILRKASLSQKVQGTRLLPPTRITPWRKNASLDVSKSLTVEEAIQTSESCNIMDGYNVAPWPTQMLSGGATS
jgi:hypothetical protein